MELRFASEYRFERCTDGLIYSPDGVYNSTFWERYLTVFSSVTIIARVQESNREPYPAKCLAESGAVSFIALPNYVGLSGYVKQKRVISKILEASAIPACAYICRVPGAVGQKLAATLNRKGIPYGAEVVGDPVGVFSKGVYSHPLRPLIKHFAYTQLYRAVAEASALLYVTLGTLQRRYPPPVKSFATYASNVELPRKRIADKPKIFNGGTAVRLVSVGSLAQLYKSPDVVLQAMVILHERGIDAHLTWVGNGQYQKKMEQYAHKLGIEGAVDFKGALPAGSAVTAELEKADLFLLASRTEGLPRALVEAMASGLPCIGTNAGGIPELLEHRAIVVPNSVEALADRIEMFVRTPKLMNAQAERNLKEVEQYVDTELQKRRVDFYRHVKAMVDRPSV